MSERIIYAPHGAHSHVLDDGTGRTACGKDGDCWPFDGPYDGEPPTCRPCAAAMERTAPSDAKEGES